MGTLHFSPFSSFLLHSVCPAFNLAVALNRFRLHARFHFTQRSGGNALDRVILKTERVDIQSF